MVKQFTFLKAKKLVFYVAKGHFTITHQGAYFWWNVHELNCTIPISFNGSFATKSMSIWLRKEKKIMYIAILLHRSSNHAHIYTHIKTSNECSASSYLQASEYSFSNSYGLKMCKGNFILGDLHLKCRSNSILVIPSIRFCK